MTRPGASMEKSSIPMAVTGPKRAIHGMRPFRFDWMHSSNPQYPKMSRLV